MRIFWVDLFRAFHASSSLWEKKMYSHNRIWRIVTSSVTSKQIDTRYVPRQCLIKTLADVSENVSGRCNSTQTCADRRESGTRQGEGISQTRVYLRILTNTKAPFLTLWLACEVQQLSFDVCARIRIAAYFFFELRSPSQLASVSYRASWRTHQPKLSGTREAKLVQSHHVHR